MVSFGTILSRSLLTDRLGKESHREVSSALTTRNSSNLNLGLEVLPNVKVRRIDSVVIVIAPEESRHWLRRVEGDSLLQLTPETVVLVGRTSEEQVVDIDGKHQPVFREPNCRGM